MCFSVMPSSMNSSEERFKQRSSWTHRTVLSVHIAECERNSNKGNVLHTLYSVTIKQASELSRSAILL
jgi:hypothetical protein